MKTLQEKIMRLFIRSSFFLIIFSVLTTLYFVTSAYADHTPHAHKPRKPGLPGYNEACDNINGSFRANTPLVGQLDPTVDEKGRPTEQCINFTRYGYPINPGEPGYIDRNVPPSTFGRPPRDSDQYSIACDSRQDTSPYGNNTWESGSCVDDAGRPCCINQTLEGYPIKIGEPGYVIQDFQREQCKNPDSLPRFIRDSPEFKQVCDLIAQEGSTPQPGSPVTGPGGSPAQAELARATAARQELEQQLKNAQAKLTKVEEAKGAAERQLAAAQDALASAAAALQAAKQAVQQETEQRTADLAIAEQAVQDAQQQLELVNTEVMTADSALVALQDQIANAEAKLASLKARQDEGVRILNDAKAKVAQLTGMSFVGDIQDSTVDAGTGSGSLPLKPGRRITPAVVAVSGGSGQQCSPTNAIQGSIPLRIICPGATSAEPFRGVLDIVEGSPSEQRPVFAIKIKTGPSWDPKWRTRITLHPDRPAIDPANRGRPVTAEIYLGFGVQPGETKFYPIKAEGRFVLIKSIDGAVDIAELEIIEGCRQPDGTINRCPGRGPVRRAAIE